MNSWPYFYPEDINKVSEILKSGKINYWTGFEGREFEKEFSSYVGVEHSVAVDNGTNALILAAHALGISKGDEVIMSPRTFVASAFSIMHLGAKPVFIDIDRNTQNMDPDLIEAAITPNTKAIMAIHLAGWPCEMDKIKEICDKHNLFLIEDCAQAHGAKYKGQSVGSFGDVNAWSFCQDKIMTTAGEGGMVTTNNKDYWSSVWSFKDHGKNYDTVYNKEHPPGFRWLHEDHGTNARMTEIQSAIGRLQLKKLDMWIDKRTKLSNIFNNAFKDLDGLRITLPPSYIKHAYYKYYVFTEPEKLKSDKDRDLIMNSLNDLGVVCYSGSCSEIYKEKAFDKMFSSQKPSLKVAKELGETSLMFLVHPTINEEDIYKICEQTKKIIKQCQR
ncbi:DegT/DnrJ/EryC1/StrS aminotransferase family protein [Candidatus Marinimicrobia bacterium]|nr:DegT/DnrJ/EryC1/StrS aminotransferase family protein [Candidatus Neomarinimicrobiota bacterium]